MVAGVGRAGSLTFQRFNGHGEQDRLAQFVAALKLPGTESVQAGRALVMFMAQGNGEKVTGTLRHAFRETRVMDCSRRVTQVKVPAQNAAETRDAVEVALFC